MNYTIEQKSRIITSGTVSISSPVIVSLNTSLVSLNNSYMYRNQGIHVHSDGQISLIVVNYRSGTMDIYQAYPPIVPNLAVPILCGVNRNIYQLCNERNPIGREC